MQISERTRPVPVLFDSSLGDGIDQVLALAALLASTARRQARLGALSISRNSLERAGFCELMVRFYRGEEPGATPGPTSVPVGMFADEPAVSAPEMIDAVLDRTGPDGRGLYPRAIEKFNDTADPVAVLRNALSAQQDQEAVVVLAGPPVNLLGLLAIPDGTDLVRNKVHSLVLADDAESSAGYSELLERWPGPVVAAGSELNLVYPATSIEQDFAWATNHPVVDAYESAGAMPYDARADSAAAVLYAIYPDNDYFGVEESRQGGPPRYRRLTTDADQRRRAEAAIRDLVGMTPPEPARQR